MLPHIKVPAIPPKKCTCIKDEQGKLKVSDLGCKIHFPSTTRELTMTTLEKVEKKIRELVPSLGKEEDYFEHRIGSHSDDYGGESDNPCYFNKPKIIELHHILLAIEKVRGTTNLQTNNNDLNFYEGTNNYSSASWDMRKSLSNQSEETLLLLNSILSDE